jgi:hypothetical protein
VDDSDLAGPHHRAAASRLRREGRPRRSKDGCSRRFSCTPILLPVATSSSHLGLTRPNALCDPSHGHGFRLCGWRPARSPPDGDLARGEDARSVRGWVSLRGRIRLLERRQANSALCQGFRWRAGAKRRRALQLFSERPDTRGKRLSVRRSVCSGRSIEWVDQVGVFAGRPRNCA